MRKKNPTIQSAATFGLRGVGPQMAKHLARLDIHSVQDLLLHLPLRYQDRTKIEAIRNLLPEQDAVIEGVITQVSRPLQGRTKLLYELRDDTGRISLRFFHVFSYPNGVLEIGTRLRCFSQVRLGPKGLEMVHPEFIVMTADKVIATEKHLTPIYPATEGLSQHMLRKLTGNALALLQTLNPFQELIPAPVLQALTLPTLQQALHFVHRPPQGVCLTELSQNSTASQQRLVFEELLAHRLSLLRLKHAFQAQSAVPLEPQRTLVSQFNANLPFRLTGAQARVMQEIEVDLTRTQPMLRLVQGDVGSGKTIIAALAMLRAVENGYQAALMAPTELLAEQHYRVFTNWLAPLGVKVVFLTGNVKTSERRSALADIANGTAQIILGTHALFQEEVNYARLAMVVIDEQHRFGVQQRAQLREKGMQANDCPHQLVMTATPIPRTLAMSFYADLDCSVIDELPPGRTPIATSVLANSRRDEIVLRIREACQQGRQVYWVCPLIDESEVLACQAATKTADELQLALPELKIGLVHGRMKAEEKQQALQNFKQNATHVLVATTVIEVGVDVPNASVMVIENAERLGLSQLHQLRGRVGRGNVASHCVLLYQYPLSMMAKERLKVMRETTDGFKIAQRDLELRGPGEVLGTRQTGDIGFRVADLMRDSEIVQLVQRAADNIIQHYPEVIEPLLQRWLGKAQAYGKV